MRKKLTLGISVVCVLCLLAGCGGKSVMTGRCLVAAGGDCLIVGDDGSPIVMHDVSSGGDLLNDLATGDKIKITHDGIAESYPAQTGVYRLKVLEHGSLADIPEDTLEALRELGWEFVTEKVPWQTSV